VSLNRIFRMRSFAVVFVLALFAASSLGAITLTSRTPEVAKPRQLDTCSFCVSFVGQSIDELLQVIVNGGVLGGCSDLCGYLPNEIEAGACNLICDYVGIEAFVDALNVTDPDPIYVCQSVDFCAEVNNGSAKVVVAQVNPKSGATGSTFNIQMEYQVTSPTGPGYLVVEILCPDGATLSGETFNDAQAVGSYGVQWQIQAQPSEQESFGAGVYQVQVAVCEGDCTTSHPYGGVYAVGQTSFTITGGSTSTGN